MHTGLQQTLETFAASSTATRDVAAFSATMLALVLAAAWLLVAAGHARTLTVSTVVRVLAVMAVAFVVATILNHVIIDTRPFIVDHTQPLVPVTHDNGFPSDHVLLASAVTCALWWIDRRFIWIFVLGTLLVMFGRMGVGAHHLEDVLGSVAITLVTTLVIGIIPLPAAWNRAVLDILRGGRRAPAIPRASR